MKLLCIETLLLHFEYFIFFLKEKRVMPPDNTSPTALTGRGSGSILDALVIPKGKCQG